MFQRSGKKSPNILKLVFRKLIQKRVEFISDSHAEKSKLKTRSLSQPKSVETVSLDLTGLVRKGLASPSFSRPFAPCFASLEMVRRVKVRTSTVSGYKCFREQRFRPVYVTPKELLLVAVPPVVVTVIGPVVALVGTVAITSVLLTTMKDADTPLNATFVTPLNPLPLIVTFVPTAPLVGVKLVITGFTSKFVVLVAVPPAVVTTIRPVLTTAETVAVTCVSEFTVNELAFTPPKATALVCVRLTPVIFTAVPTAPLAGLKLVICGMTRNL